MLGNILSGFTEAQPVGIGGFKAYATVNESTRGTRMLPTSVLEDGSHAHDHIIVEPIKVEMTIDISDRFIELEPMSAVFKDLDPTLGAITQFLPVRANSTISKMNNIRTSIDQTLRQANNVLDVGANLFSLFGGAGVNNNRDAFVQALHTLHNSDSLITLQTKHKTYKNMALSSFDYTTDNERRAIEANLEFTQVEFRSLLAVAIDKMQKSPAPGAKGTVGGVTEKGTQGVDKKPVSLINVLGKVTRDIFK